MTFAQPFADYEILDRVGAGAMGTVFKARHKKLNRIVALKVLKPSLARDSRYVDRLKREARIVASLSHPNIVTGFDLGEEGGYHYFVMEFVEGKSLRALLTEWGMFAEEYVHKVARQVALALDHAYQRGVIHRDIKPGNILIDEAGGIKLTDMGLAKGPADLTLTRDGATVGTPQYISPEQARNPHDVDVRTDLYSLGATLYHMATGVPPFRGDTMAELITNVLNELPVSPRAINSALSEGMSLVIRKLLAKDLTVRYQTPRDLLDDLDRLEKSLPPQIDPARLSEGEGERVRWWPRALLVVGVAALLGLAWWIGVQTRGPAVSPPTASEFMAALDDKLASLPTLGERLVHLRTVQSQPVPVGSEQELTLRQRTLDADLQRAVDAVAEAFTGDGFTQLVAWLRDPAVWPDRQKVLREKVSPRLVAATGLALGQLPSSLRLARLDELQQSIARTLTERDNELVVRFEEFLRNKVPASADLSVLAGDFARAEVIWEEALTRFCDGVVLPAEARLEPAVREMLLARHREAKQQALRNVILVAESRVEESLRAEVAEVCRQLQQQLRTGLAPQTVEQQLQRFRRDLDQDWPSAKSFRAGRNPWPGIDRQLAELQAEIRLAVAREEDERFVGRLHLVWRTFCHGRAEDALALLPAAAAGSPREPLVQRHRRALQAARAVEQAIGQAIANRPTVGFLRAGSADAIELRGEPDGDAWRLVGSVLGQPPRPVHLTELRFGNLLARLQAERDPLANLSALDRALGVLVCRLVGDDLVGLASLVAALGQDDERFLHDEVWPRILKVRQEQPEAPLDRAELFTRLRTLREAAVQTGTASELDAVAKVLAQCVHVVPAAERSNAEADELRATQAFVQLATRRRDLLQGLQAAAPRGADTAVRIVDDELVAEVALAGAVLQRDAKEGWELRGELLEFAGGGRPWSELDQQALQGTAGIEPTALRTTLVVDMVLPPTSVGWRLWAFEFRGLTVLLVVGANDTAHAALIEGDLRREESVQKAFGRAIAGVLGTGRPVVVPGAVHRLTFEIVATSQRTAAAVRVSLEGAELLAQKLVPLDPQRPPTFSLHPQQDLAVRRILVRASGL